MSTINIYPKYITILTEVSAIHQNFLRLHTLRDLSGFNCWVRHCQVCINAADRKIVYPVLGTYATPTLKTDPEMEEGYAHFIGVFHLGNILKEHMILLVCMCTRRSRKKTSFVCTKNDSAGLPWLSKQIMKWKQLHLSKNWGPLMPNFISLSMSAIWQVAISQSKSYGMENT